MKLNDLEEEVENTEKKTVDNGENVINSIEYVLIHSDILNDNILLLFDKKYLKAVREKFPDMVVYFPPEIEILHRADDIKLTVWVHRIKKEFRGWIFPNSCKFFKEKQ